MGEELNIGKIYFCPAKDVGTENEKWREIKKVERLSLSEPTEKKKEEWPRSFSFSIDCPIEGDVGKIFRSLTRPRKKRKGERERRRRIRSGKTLYRTLHYLNKIGRKKPKRRTIFDVWRDNECLRAFK